MTPSGSSTVYLGDFTVAALEDMGYDTYLNNPWKSNTTEKVGPAPNNDIFLNVYNSSSSALRLVEKPKSEAFIDVNENGDVAKTTKATEAIMSDSNADTPTEETDVTTPRYFQITSGAEEYYTFEYSLFEVAMLGSNSDYIYKWFGVEVGNVDALKEVAPQVFVRPEPVLKNDWEIGVINENRKGVSSLEGLTFLDPSEELFTINPFVREPISDPSLTLAFLTSNNDGYLIQGEAGEDTLEGTAGNDLLTGLEGKDVLTGGDGHDVLDGGADEDIASFSGAQSSYTLTQTRSASTLLDRRTEGDGVDTLMNLEFLDFDTDLMGELFELTKFDGLPKLSEAQVESFVELYIAYFDRAPDALGLNFWGTAHANGMSLAEIASEFLKQDETKDMYPADQTVLDFATTVYANVLGRTPDQDGLNFWVGHLESGSVTKDTFILEVLKGVKATPSTDAAQQFIDQQLADRQYLEDKTDLGAYFSVIKGMSDVSNAEMVMQMFANTNDTATVVSKIDEMFAAAQDVQNGEFLMPLVGVMDDPFVL